MDNSEFPTFSDADTILTADTGHVWKLHRFQLARNCPKLHKLFTDASTRIAKGPGDASDIIYGLSLQFDGNLMKILPGTVSNADKNDSSQHTTTNGITQTHSAAYRAYNNFFRLLYEMDAELSSSSYPDQMSKELIDILDVAEDLGAAKAVRKAIEPSLISVPGFWKRVSEFPMHWSDIGCRLQSSTILKEAMCHAIGQYNVDSRQIAEDRAKNRGDLSDLQKLRNIKHEELDLLKMEIEEKILNFYPTSMHPGQAQGTGGAKRSIYANNIYQWQALLLIRQWMTRSICKNQHHLSTMDGGLSFYRKLGAGGDAYVDEHEVATFHKTFPMSSKGQEIFRNSIYAVKDQISPLLQPLLIDRSLYGQILPKDLKLPYFTCCTITDSELPWMKKEVTNEKTTIAGQQKQVTSAPAGEPTNKAHGIQNNEQTTSHDQQVVYPIDGSFVVEEQRHGYNHSLSTQQSSDATPQDHSSAGYSDLAPPSSKRPRVNEDYVPMHNGNIGSDHMMSVGMAHMPLMSVPSSGVDSALRVTQQRESGHEMIDRAHPMSQDAAMLHHINTANMSMHHQHSTTPSFEHMQANEHSYPVYTEADHIGGNKRDWHEAN